MTKRSTKTNQAKDQHELITTNDQQELKELTWHMIRKKINTAQDQKEFVSLLGSTCSRAAVSSSEEGSSA